MSARAHYHVGNNTVGYLPDSDPYMANTKREAISASRSDARQWLESDRETEASMPKSDQLKPWMNGRDGHYYVGNDSPTHLERHFWIDGPCTCDDVEDES